MLNTSGCAFSISSKRTTRRPSPDGLGELAALVVADVARGGANQARDGVLLHVLAHVDAHHGRLVVERNSASASPARSCRRRSVRGTGRSRSAIRSAARRARGEAFATASRASPADRPAACRRSSRCRSFCSRPRALGRPARRSTWRRRRRSPPRWTSSRRNAPCFCAGLRGPRSSLRRLLFQLGHAAKAQLRGADSSRPCAAPAPPRCLAASTDSLILRRSGISCFSRCQTLFIVSSAFADLGNLLLDRVQPTGADASSFSRPRADF